jgi:hypothetical protein
MAGKEKRAEAEREISDSEVERLDHSAFVQYLVEGGASRLTAERMATIRDSGEEPGRARHHRQLRR